MAPNDPSLPVCIPCRSPPLSMGRNCDLLLTYNIWQRWWDVTFVIMLLLSCFSVLLEDSVYWLSPLLALMKSVDAQQGPHGKIPGQLPTDSDRHQRTESFHQPQELKREFFLHGAFELGPSLAHALIAEDLARLCLDSCPMGAVR